MKAISLWQPWASLIAIGAKPFETRSWAPPKALIGQRIAIHAAKVTLDQVLARDALSASTAREVVLAFRRPEDRNNNAPITLREIEHLPLGAVVCTAVLSEAFQIKPATAWAPDPFGDYSPGRWIWVLDHVRRLAEPIPWKGRQGFFDVEFPEVER